MSGRDVQKAQKNPLAWRGAGYLEFGLSVRVQPLPPRERVVIVVIMTVMAAIARASTRAAAVRSEANGNVTGIIIRSFLYSRHGGGNQHAIRISNGFAIRRSSIDFNDAAVT